MNTRHIFMAALALTAGLSGAAQAAIYTNPSSETPFDLSLDTGPVTWQDPSVTLNSSTAVRSYTATTILPPVDHYVYPRPGITGAFFQTQTTIENYYSQNYQSLNIDFAINPSSAVAFDTPITYTISGQISKKSTDPATLLYSGGYQDLNLNGFVIFLIPENVDGYHLESNLITFKVGSAPGDWSDQGYGVIHPGQTSEFGGTLRVDLNAPVFFEVDFSLDLLSQDLTQHYSALIFQGALSVSATLNDAPVLLHTRTSTQHVPGSLAVIPALPTDPVPVPEPETYAMMLVGLALVGAAARRRRG